MKPSSKTNNLVAKYARRYNKATVQVDRKKQQKRGYMKHKGDRSGYHTALFSKKYNHTRALRNNHFLFTV